MSTIPQVSSGAAPVATLHQWGRWSVLSSRVGSGEQWSLAKKIVGFVLLVLGLIVLSRCRISVNRTTSTTTNTRDKNVQKVVDAGVMITRQLKLNKPLPIVEFHLPGILQINVSEHAGDASLTFSADRNIMEVLETHEQSDRLLLRQKPNTSMKTSTPIQYTLTIPHLQEVVVSATGRVVISQLKGQVFKCTMRDDAQVSVTEGKVQEQHITISGNGKYYASTVESQFSIVKLKDNAFASIKTPELPFAVKLSDTSTLQCTGKSPSYSIRKLTETGKIEW